MKKRGKRIGQHGIIIMFSVLNIWIPVACEDRLEDSERSGAGENTISVSLNLGLENSRETYALSPSKAGNNLPGFSQMAFEGGLLSKIATKGDPAESILKPDKLYNLEIRQYDAAGNHLTGVTFDSPFAIGSNFTANLKESADCQLVFVVWGEGNTTRLGAVSLAEAQKISLGTSVIKDLNPASQADMNKMPYILYLKHIKIVNTDDANGIIQSKNEQNEDVRIRLKRLATRLHLTWNYHVSGYSLQQILLQSIPLNYIILPKPEGDEQTYPSLLDRFTTIQISGALDASGSYSCWVPANVRGYSPAAVNVAGRTKGNAPIGSSYISFIASKTGDSKKKLDYRVYLGGESSTDFNVYGNADYKYVLGFSHSGTNLPVNDRRITIIDPIPASESNNNVVPTANCFMIAPGGAFCFDPFSYQQNGNPITNPTLKNWADSEGGIAYVKLLWQTKENGDVGDPVMGIVNSPADHTNIVDIKMNDGSEVSKTALVSDIGQARIYCRVASNTIGGSGMIAAYNQNDQIIWSWHIWVTDYNPDARGNVNVLEPAYKRKQKYVMAGVDDQLPMMDRNLGAMEGFVTLPTDPIDMSKACGFHYQGGRKDPFPSSYSSNVIYSVDFNANDKIPPVGMLNQYGPDGITYFPHQGSTATNTVYRTLYQYPYQLFRGLASGQTWDSTLKNEHDPCPAGWRIPEAKNYRALFETDSYISNNNVNGRFQARGVTGDMVSFLDKGKGNGYLLYYDDTHVSYFRMTGYPPFYYQFRYVGTCGNLWTREFKRGFTFGNGVVDAQYHSFCIGTSWGMSDAHTLRCIQELE